MANEQLVEKGKQWLNETLNFFDLNYDLYGEEKSEEFLFTIEGESLGLIIGKEGNVLYSLQDVLRVYLRKAFPENEKRIKLDINGYQHRRENGMRRLIQSIMNEVMVSGVQQKLDPMPNYDRAFVHQLVSSNPKLQSFSEGERDQRAVVIALS